MLFFYVEEMNVKYVFGKFWYIVKVIGMNVKDKSDEECFMYVIDVICQFFREVGIFEKLFELGVMDFDFELFVDNVMKDVCVFGNLYQFLREEVMEFFCKIIQI